MTTDLTDIARRAIDLAGKATPGPWREERRDDPSFMSVDLLVSDSEIVGCVACNSDGCPQLTEGDAAFIAFSRDALPALAEAYLALRETALRAVPCVCNDTTRDGDCYHHELERAILRQAVKAVNEGDQEAVARRAGYEEAREQAAGIADEHAKRRLLGGGNAIAQSIRAMATKDEEL